MKKISKLLCLGAILSPLSYAEININGFATIAGGVTDSDESLYGYDDDVSFDPDSVAGLQVSGDMGNGLGATVQMVARGGEDWDLEAEWAYISYELNDYTKILAGKQRAPFYMYSDYLDVGYAYHWITPPEGVYSLPFDSITGVGLLYTRPLGPLDSSLQLLFGRNSDEIELSGSEGDIDVTNLASFAWSVTYEWLTLRAGYSVGDLDLSLESADFNALVGGWNQAGFAELAEELEVKEDGATFSELGFSIDHNNLLIVGEWTELDTGDNFLAVQESAYLSVGYRFGKIMPSITYGEDEDTVDSNTYSAVPLGLNPILDALRLGSEALVNTQKVDSDYVTVGVRWDFHDSAALKADYTEYDDNLGNADASLFRVAITTVF